MRLRIRRGLRARALDQADSLLARGLASEARNGAVLAGTWADRAAQLEAEAREQEAHELRLEQARGGLVVALLERAFAAIALPLPQQLMRELLRAWPDEVTGEVVERARVEVRRAIAVEVREQMLARAGGQPCVADGGRGR